MEFYLPFVSFPSERLEGGVSRRSVPIVVTICTDAYITIGGGGSFGGTSYTVYKGTTCRTCLADEYPELNPGEYEAGGFPEYGTAVDKGHGGGNNPCHTAPSFLWGCHGSEV